jgi:hypothetical protein
MGYHISPNSFKIVRASGHFLFGMAVRLLGLIFDEPSPGLLRMLLMNEPSLLLLCL